MYIIYIKRGNSFKGKRSQLFWRNKNLGKSIYKYIIITVLYRQYITMRDTLFL